MTRRPDLFIVGAPKSGTTSLYDYLAGHPDVYMAPVKEPHYFSPDVEGGMRRAFRYGEDEDDYLALFADAGRETRLGEASTRYLVSRLAPVYINRFQPDARIIVMLRNPVDFVHALHNERVSNGSENVEDFEKALDLDEERRAGRHLPPNANPLGSVYRDNALFGEQLARWLDVFPPSRTHVIIFDDFAADTAGEFRKVLEFLEVDKDYRPMSFAARNRSSRLRGGTVRALLNSRPAQWVAHGFMPALIGSNATSRLARRFRHSRINRRPSPREPVSPALRRRLEDEFAADVTTLSGLLGRDLNAEWFGRSAEPPIRRAEAVV